MPAAELPPNEEARLAELRAYGPIDSACRNRFDSLTRIAARVTHSPIAVVSLVEADKQVFPSRQGLDVSHTSREVSFCAHAILAPHSALVVEDATRDPRFADNALVTAAPAIRAYAGIPLVNAQGYALGTLCVIDGVPRQYTAEDLETLRGLAQAVITTLELHRSTTALHAMARADVLTELPTRYAFLDGLRDILATGEGKFTPFGLLCLDLDGFHRINDMAGYATGDAVLVMAGMAIRSVLRDHDMPARLNGDKFAALLPLADLVVLHAVAENMRATLEDCMATCDWPVTASIGGICFGTPPRDENEALLLASRAVETGRAEGANRVFCRTYGGGGKC